MRPNFLQFIRSRDFLGRPVTVQFKGQETYKTLCGGVLSIVMQSMILYLLAFSFYEMFFMDNPQIISYDKPLSSEDK